MTLTGNGRSFFLSIRMRICTTISDFEVERAKNAFRTSMFMHLDGTVTLDILLVLHWLYYEHLLAGGCLG